MHTSAALFFLYIIHVLCIFFTFAATTTTKTTTSTTTTATTTTPIPMHDKLLPLSDNITIAMLSVNIDMDSHWTTETLIARQHYDVELHQLTTEDGYILTMHRLPRHGHQPVLLVHGLYGSANDFIIMGRNVSLAYALWDAKYDVWLANCRGSHNSQKHSHLARDELRFWNFSFHDLGVYDLPALIDYVRSNTSFHEMHFVGYSQGATALLVMAAMRPKYVEKLALVQLLAPLAFMRHSNIERSYVEYINVFLKDPHSREIREFLPRGFLKQLNCLQHKLLQLSCLQLIFLIVGADTEQFDQSKLMLLFKQMPAGGSVKQLRHFHQIFMNGGTFQHYDYGFEGNYDKYARATPPTYNLSQLHVPVVLYFGANDRLVNGMDVHFLSQQLPQLRRLLPVPHPQFNHLDFIWAKDLANLVNARVLQEFAEFKHSN